MMDSIMGYLFITFTLQLVCGSEFAEVNKREAISGNRYNNNGITKSTVTSRHQPEQQLAPVLTVIPFNSSCQTSRDCLNIDQNMDCYENYCHCKQGYVYFYHTDRTCFRQARWEEECMFTKQCISTTRNTACRDRRCTCNNGYAYNGFICSPTTSPRSKATEVYTAALVAISCIMVAITCILVGCVVKKSSQLRNYQSPPSLQSRESDVFTVAEEFAAIRAEDKPPTYDEVMQNEQMQFGIPPPDYPSSPSTTPLNYASAIPGPSYQPPRETFPDQARDDADAISLSPSIHELSNTSCSTEGLALRTNNIEDIPTSSNVTIELVTNRNSNLQTAPSLSLLPFRNGHQNQINASSATDGELGAYANLAFSLDV